MLHCSHYRSAGKAGCAQRRKGLTLIEVVVAMLLFTAGALALAGSAAAIARQFAASERRARAVTVARSRAELTHSKPCDALSSGSEEVFGIASVWSIGNTRATARIEQVVTRLDSRGIFRDRFFSAVACD